jgi:dihydrofolate reductase
MIKIIAAASFNGVIGKNNTLPWKHDYKEDLAYFRKMTTDSTVMMGRKTFESIGRLLPKRNNIILTKQNINIPGAQIYNSFYDAVSDFTKEDKNLWIIGGSYVYQAGLELADELHITTIPEIIDGSGLIYFPYINPDFFEIKERIELSKEKNLYCNIFKRKLAL